MSETPSETDHIDHAEEPSMEDILASIRKIIADDDQGMESTAPETAIAPAGLNSRGYASEALVTGSFGGAPAEAKAPETDQTYDKNSVFKELRGPSSLDDILKSDFETDDDFVDLDIEALLNQADAPLETFDDAANKGVSDHDDLMDILAMEIPHVDSELSLKPATHFESGAVLSTGGVAASIAEANVDSVSESVTQPQVGSGVDSLMDDIDDLLFDGSEGLDNDKFGLAEFAEADDIPEPIGDRNGRKGLLGAGLAAVGFGAKARQKSTPPKIEQPSLDEESLKSDDDLDAMLESLIGDIDMGDKAESSAEIPPETIMDESSLAERPSLQTDDEDMDLVRSLMAELTDPGTDASLSDFADENLETLEGDSFEDEVSEFEPPLSAIDKDSTFSANEQAFETDAGDVSDFDIEALLNGDVSEDELDDLMSETTLSNDQILAENIDGYETDNILNDILDMSLEDELSGHEEDIDSLLEIPAPESSENMSGATVNEMIGDSDLPEELPFELSEGDMLPDVESVLADEVENLALNETAVEETAAEPQTEEKSSLLEIAMEAEKDADVIEAQAEAELVVIPPLEPQADVTDLEQDITSDAALETSSPLGAIAAASGLGLAATAIAASVSNQTDASDEDDLIAQELVSELMASEEAVLEKVALEDISIPETHEEDASSHNNDEIISTNTPSQTDQNIQKETANMPSAAAKSETILDEVTTSSTAEVFASLNQVVEEKAIVAERGDRIGDLVMEALRPMLKDWLDENLKGIVERAVAKEVKRISSAK